MVDARPWIVVTVSCVFAILVARHYDALNGPEYWKWPWRNLATLSVSQMLAALIPFVVAQWGFARRDWPRWSVLLLLMLTTFALETVAAGARPSSGAHPVAETVWDPFVTSYFTDAGSVTSVTSWIRSFPELMPSFHLHALNKPPFGILFYVPFIKLFGYNLRAALIGGFAVGGLATLSVPAVYMMIGRLVGSSDVAFCSASFFALTPSLVLFMPEFDQMFPVLGCGLIAIWASALDSDRIRSAVAVGLLLFAITLASYSLLLLGVFLVLQARISLTFGERDVQFTRIVKHATTVVVTFAVAQGILMAFGYRPLAVFKTAVALQSGLLRSIPRPYPQTVLFDLTDLLLGSGWIAFVVLVFYISRHRRGPLERPTALVAAGLAQLIVVAVLGLLPGETARVWIFLLPFLMLPVGLELVRWKPAARMMVYASLWLITVTIAKNMKLL